MTEAVRVSELTRTFGDFIAVDKVTFDVERGEIFGFLGPNGAGKTTTIKMLTGLLRPTSGSARVAGYDVATDANAVKSSIGYMSQLFSLYPDLAVEENIQLFAGLYGVSDAQYDKRLNWVLEMSGLSAYSKRRTADLPLGWKQRLALGCAVLHEPPILFLDEPTSGVDPLARRRFWDLIYDLAEAGTAVFVSTHYMEEAEYCSRLALMNKGRLIALDKPSALKGLTDEPIFEVETDKTPDAIDALQQSQTIIDAAMFGRALHVTVKNEADGEQDIPRILEAAGRSCISLRRVTPSLEDVFVSLIRREGGAAIG